MSTMIIIMMMIVIFESFLFEGIYSSKSQPWPLTIHKVAGSCCDLYFNYLSHNLSRLIHSYDKLQKYNSSSYFPSKTSLREKALFACLLHQVNSSGIKETEIGSNSERVMISTAVYYPLRKDATKNYSFNGHDHFNGFMDNNIMVYAHLQFAVMSAYAEHNGYQHVFATYPYSIEKETKVGERIDYRWQKIKHMRYLMETSSSKTEIFVWIDADAIILDFGLTIQSVVDEVETKYGNADIIASADIRMGLINTGFLILRNTLWTRDFLDTWWNIADRESVSDQDAFDLAYRAYLSENRDVLSKVAVLPMEKLNSHPPAMLNQEPHHQVLHLMGESPTIRQEVFRRAFYSICSARSGGILPLQLGVDRPSIFEISRNIYRAEVNKNMQKIRLRKMKIDTAVFNFSSYAKFEHLAIAAHHYSDVINSYIEQRSGRDSAGEANDDLAAYESEVLELRRQIFKLSVDNVESIRAALVAWDTDSSELDIVYKESTMKSKNDSSSSDEDVMDIGAQRKKVRTTLVEEFLMMLKKVAESGNDLFGASKTYVDKVTVANKVFSILNELVHRVAEGSKRIPMHMMALMHQNMGKLEYETSIAFSLRGQQFIISANKHLNQSLTQLNASICVFEKLYTLSTMDTSTSMEYIHSLQLFAGVTCDAAEQLPSQNKYDSALTLWNKAILSARSSLHGLTVGIQYENFPVVLYNAAICFNSGERWQTAKKILHESIAIMESIKSQQFSGSGSDPILPKYKDIYANAKVLLQSLLSKTSTTAEISHEFSLDSSSAAQDRVLQVVLPSGERKTYSVAPSEVGVDGVGIGEWVECEETDLNCEVFEVYDDEPDDDALISKDVQSTNTSTTSSTSRSSSSSSRNYSIVQDQEVIGVDSSPFVSNLTDAASATGGDSVIVDDPSIYDGLDEEEKEELRYTRERYARLASRSRPDGGGEFAGSQHQNNFDLSVDLKAAASASVQTAGLMGSSSEGKPSNKNDGAKKKTIQAIEQKLDCILQELQSLKDEIKKIYA